MAQNPRSSQAPNRSNRPNRPNDDAFDEFRSRLLLQLATDILLDGFSLVPVGFGHCAAPGCDCALDEDSWAYTVGLAEQGLPEIVAIGLAPVYALELIHRLRRHHLEVAPVVTGKPYLLDDVRIKLAPVPPEWLAHDIDRMAMWVCHYGPGRAELTIPPIAQLLFADGQGRFPDEPGCDPVVAEGQHLLSADPVSYPALAPRRVRRRSTVRRTRAVG